LGDGEVANRRRDAFLVVEMRFRAKVGEGDDKGGEWWGAERRACVSTACMAG
jgi:hypothetical protein